MRTKCPRHSRRARCRDEAAARELTSADRTGRPGQRSGQPLSWLRYLGEVDYRRRGEGERARVGVRGNDRWWWWWWRRRGRLCARCHRGSQSQRKDDGDRSQQGERARGIRHGITVTASPAGHSPVVGTDRHVCVGAACDLSTSPVGRVKDSVLPALSIVEPQPAHSRLLGSRPSPEAFTPHQPEGNHDDESADRQTARPLGHPCSGGPGSGEHSGYHRSGLLRQCIAEYHPDHHSHHARVDTEHEHGHRPFGVGGFRCCPHAVRWLMSTASRWRCAAHPADRSVSAATQSG